MVLFSNKINLNINYYKYTIDTQSGSASLLLIKYVDALLSCCGNDFSFVKVGEE
jgi:hypothetical protein